MKNKYVVASFWFIVTTLVIAWASYQSWKWFFEEKNPVTNYSIVITSTKPVGLKVVNGPSNDPNKLQDASPVQITANPQTQLVK